MFRMWSRLNTRTRTAMRWVGGVCACVVIVLVVRLTSDRSDPSAGPGMRRASGSPEPADRYRLHERAQPRPNFVARTEPADRIEAARAPELEARLRAAAHVVTVSDPSSAHGPAVPPGAGGPTSPEQEVQRHTALATWRIQAQQLLDECTARPAAERRPVPLDVVFAPAAPAPRLAPSSVSMPPHELQRLWRDTDPDALQGCLERVRTLALPVPTGPASPAQTPPVSMETVLVQL